MRNAKGQGLQPCCLTIRHVSGETPPPRGSRAGDEPPPYVAGGAVVVPRGPCPGAASAVRGPSGLRPGFLVVPRLVGWFVGRGLVPRRPSGRAPEAHIHAGSWRGPAALILLLLLPGLAQAAPGPRSPVIFPEQEIALRFSHAQHLRKGVKCAQCHNQIARSELASDRNIPGQGRCEACHEVEEAKAGKKVDPPSACQDCHPGFDWTVHRAPRPSRFPAPNLIFSHARHLDRGAQCAECHGDMTAVDLATRDQLPRMATCLGCHDGARAPSACATCHVGSTRARGAPIETHFASGVLRPGPGNPLGLDHGPRFERAHAQLAAHQRDQCMACHTESSCMKCHDAATRPQAVHPGDFISTHMVAARQDDPRCDSCHRRQSFCVACHERTGVGPNAAPAFRDLAAKVHPPGWVTPPGPGHHGVQAARNIGTCASCHREEQCVLCHRVGSGEIPLDRKQPHPPGFASRCADLLRKNDRACAKCHDPATLAGLCR